MIHSMVDRNTPDQDSLRRHLKARTRYAYWKSHPESHLIQSPE